MLLLAGKARVGQFGLPFVKYPQSDADACYNLESSLFRLGFVLKIWVVTRVKFRV